MKRTLPDRWEVQRWCDALEEGLEGSTDATLPGYTYIVRCGDRYKIGKTTDIARRVSAFQVANVDQVELVCAKMSLCPEFWESELHVHFQCKKIRGEWYQLNEDDILFLRRWADGKAAIP